MLGDFADVQIAKQSCAFFVKENIRTFDVSVENFEIVKAGQRLQGADQHPPNLVFSECSFVLFVFYDFLIEISVTCVVHHYAQSFTLVNERFFVTYNVLVLNRGQDSDLIKSVLLLLLTQILKRNFLQGVSLAI